LDRVRKIKKKVPGWGGKIEKKKQTKLFTRLFPQDRSVTGRRGRRTVKDKTIKKGLTEILVTRRSGGDLLTKKG